MPFKECSTVSLREDFCCRALADGANRRGLCREYGIGPTTGYKWLARYVGQGAAGLAERSRRPHASPLQTPPAMEAAVVALRARHPCWGGRKLARVLEREGLTGVPSPSTITAILRRHGMLDGPRAGEKRDYVRFEHLAPNDLWQMDFKGHFALAGVGARCHPLTLLDDHSRYALELGACADERSGTVKARLERLFARYGLPRRILADNGSPWGSSGGERYTRLGVWLLDLDVGIAHGRPYHPQTQGKEERFHRTLNTELIARSSFDGLADAQAAFDRWRELYNHRRPHEAIALEVPASRYRPSSRAMPEAIAPPEYDAAAHVRRADEFGRITFKRRKIRCSKAFAGRQLALYATQTDGLLELRYRNHILSQVDLRENMVQTVHHVPEHTSTLCPV